MRTVLTNRDKPDNQYIPRRLRMKRMEPSRRALNCAIYHAEDVDNRTNYPSVTERHYCTIFWTEPGKEFNTHIVRGFPNPVWKESFHMISPEPNDWRFLNLEIVRLNSKIDPGTSNGFITVGRAQIPLPKKVSKKKAGRFGLVRFEETGIKAEGHIILPMELQELCESVYD